MKKLSILVIALILVTGFAFGADEFDGTPSTDIDITASVTWGVDLNENTTGFYNSGSFDAELTWLDEEDFEKGGDDGVYGWIKVNDATLKVDGGVLSLGFDKIEAKLVISPLEIKIYGAPSFGIDNAVTDASEAVVFDDDTGEPAANEAAVGTVITADNTIWGVTITAPIDPITVSVKFASDGDWTAQTADDSVYGDYSGDGTAAVNTDNDYILGIGLDVDVAPIEVGFDLTYGWFQPTTVLGLGATVDVELPVMMGLDLGVAFDGIVGIDPEVDFAWDTELTAALALTEENDDDDAAEFTFSAYFAEYAASDDFDLDLVIGFAEPEAMGFVDMLYANLGFELHDVLAATGNDMNFAVTLDGGYDTGDVDPYFETAYYSDGLMSLGLGVVLKSGLTGLDNTTITLDYQADDLTDEDAAITNDIGIFTIKTSVSF